MSKGRCVAKRPRGKKPPKRCTLYRPVGSFSHTDTVGHNAFRFTGRVRRNKLKPGTYRLQATPKTARGRGTTRITTFKIVR